MIGPFRSVPTLKADAITLILIQWSGTHGVTVRVEVTATPLVAVMVTVLVIATVLVVTVNVALVLPAATVTLKGTVATVVNPLERVTTAPAEGAGPVRVTVPVEVNPPLTLVGLKVMELATGV